MKSFTAIIILILCSILLLPVANGQVVVSDNPAAVADPAAMLDLQSTGKGLLIPRMTMAQRDAIASPPTSLVVYQTDNTPGLYYNIGIPASPDWQKITDANFIGGYWTQTGSDIYYDAGNVGVGTTSPGVAFDVKGRPGTIRIDAEPNYGSTLHFGYNGTNRFTLFNRLAAGPPAYSADYLTLHSTESVAGTNPHSGSFSNNPDLVGFHPEGRIFQNYQGVGAAYMIYSYAEFPMFYIEVENGGADANGIQSRVKSATSDVGSLCIGGWNEGHGNAVYGQNKLADNYGYLGTENHGAYGENDVTGNRGALGTPTTGAYGIHDASANQGNLGLLNFGVQGTHGTSDYWAALGTSNAGVYARLTPNGATQVLADGDFAIKGVGVEIGSDNNRGNNYALGNQVGGVTGYNTAGTRYSAGVAGYTNDNEYPDGRTSGVFGGIDNASAWGAVGYENSSNNNYGGYFTNQTTGTGKAGSEPSSSIGAGIFGDLFGAHVDGNIYGLYATGGNYGIYSDGDVYRTGADVHLQQDNSGNNNVMYTLVSPEMTIQTYGIGQLQNGKSKISFDDAFANVVSSAEPIIVTVTPIGKSEGVYLEKVDSKGFTVAENRDGKSNVQFSWVAFGKRTGYENMSLPADVIASDYNDKVQQGLHNDADITTDGEGLYYRDGKLMVGQVPQVKTGDDASVRDIKLDRSPLTEKDKDIKPTKDKNLADDPDLR